jgi:RND family efflux transporter MFP subunit
MKRLTVCVIATLLLVACAKAPSAEDAAPAKVPVQVVRAQAGVGRDVVTAYGTIEASPDAVRTLSAPFDAVVTAVPVVAGDKVAAGASVVTLTPTPAVEASLQKAAKDLGAAQVQVAQAQRLYDEHLATNADLASARQALGAAQATSDDLRRRVGKGGARGLPAGVTGVVVSLASQPGAVVATGAPLASVGSARAAVARIGLPPEQAVQVHRGDPAAVTLLGGKTTLHGRVSRVSEQVDAQTRLAPVLIALPASGAAFGTSIQAEIAVGAPHQLIWVPKAAVAANGAQPAVFVVDKGIAHERSVQLGQERGDMVALREGVGPGETVVTIGAGTLQDGAAVSIEQAGR